MHEENSTARSPAIDLNRHPVREGQYVLYWMQAAQRVRFNPALAYAADLANTLKKPLLVCFCLKSDIPAANIRHYSFMLDGIYEVRTALEEKGVAFTLLLDHDPDCLSGQAVAAVVDYGPLRWQREWRMRMADCFSCRLTQIETNTVVPVDALSLKEEYAAVGVRKKLHRLIDARAFESEPKFHLAVRASNLALPKHALHPLPDKSAVLMQLSTDRSVAPVKEVKGGEREAWRLLRRFISESLPNYAEMASDPSRPSCSGLSPYLHFGQISPAAVTKEVLSFCTADNWPPTDSKKARDKKAVTDNSLIVSRDAFLEQLLVRRELAVNFAVRNFRYDSYESLPSWAKNTLKQHANDRREYSYPEAAQESADTHDRYWNAAQTQLLTTGHMHNYMRMYWGKKVIEWSISPEAAYEVLIRLNDKYQLDGRDANGYAGIAWCFGKHDRPWKERPIFGMVRYMNADGLRRKFDIESYARRILED